MAFIFKEVQHRTVAPVIIDEDKCIADKGCTVCRCLSNGFIGNRSHNSKSLYAI